MVLIVHTWISVISIHYNIIYCVILYIILRYKKPIILYFELKFVFLLQNANTSYTPFLCNIIISSSNYRSDVFSFLLFKQENKFDKSISF